MLLVAAFNFAMFASADIFQRKMACWSLWLRNRDGESCILTAACSGWLSAFWNRTWKRERDRTRLKPLVRPEGPEGDNERQNNDMTGQRTRRQWTRQQ